MHNNNFISLHCNSLPDPSKRVEAYAFILLPPMMRYRTRALLYLAKLDFAEFHDHAMQYNTFMKK